MYMQALSNLGTPQTIEILKPYIMGHENAHIHDEHEDLVLATNAIWALNKFNMHDTAESYVCTSERIFNTTFSNAFS